LLEFYSATYNCFMVSTNQSVNERKRKIPYINLVDTFFYNTVKSISNHWLLSFPEPPSQSALPQSSQLAVSFFVTCGEIEEFVFLLEALSQP